MKIRIEEISGQTELTYVRAHSTVGDFWASWHGKVPAVGREYFVELDLKHLQRAAATTTNAPAIRGTKLGEPVTVIGQVLEVQDEFGVTTILVGDSIVMVNGGKGIAVNAWLECRTHPLDVYDMDL